MPDMGLVEGAGAGGIAGAVIFLGGKLLDKLPMFKGKNGNGHVSKTDMALAISEHKVVCLESLNKRFDEVKDHISTKNDELRDTLVTFMLDQNKR